MSLEKPIVDESFRVLHKKAHEFISDQHEFLTEHFGFADFDQYQIEEATSSIHFLKNQQEVLALSYQPVGYLDDAGHWHWHWQAENQPQAEREQLEVVKNYGDMFNFALLTEAEWPATDADAWAVTAVCGYLRAAKGIFKARINDRPTFIYFKEMIGQE